MAKFSIPHTSDEVLFEATLEPLGEEIDKVSKNGDISEGEIEVVKGIKNKVAVGKPYYENFVSRLIEENQDIPHEIKHMTNNYDFHFVSLSCSFRPEGNCRFIWVRFGIDLNAMLKETNELARERPIAYYMHPTEVQSKTIFKREVNFKPAGKFNFGFAKVGVESNVKTSKEFINYEPQIFAFGINRPSVSWNFRSTKEKGIWGDKKDLILIVKAPKNSKIKGRFILGAEVEYKLRKWLPIPISKKKDKLVDDEYDLSD